MRPYLLVEKAKGAQPDRRVALHRFHPIWFSAHPPTIAQRSLRIVRRIRSYSSSEMRPFS